MSGTYRTDDGNVGRGSWTAALALVVSIVALVVAACSTVPIDENASAAEGVPDDLFDTTTTTTVDTVPEETGFDLVVYFVNVEDQLVEVVRPSEDRPNAQNVLDGLAAQPTPEEIELAEEGITTRLLPDMNPTQGEFTGEGLLFVEIEGPQLREASTNNFVRVRNVYRQIVCSLVELNAEVLAVALVDPEGPILFTAEDGTIIEGGVTPEALNECKTAADIAAEVAAEVEEEAGETGDGDGDGGTTTTGG
ncbi:MAG: hypothetical protein AAF467_10725 [Actinomycetota bacterium]